MKSLLCGFLVIVAGCSAERNSSSTSVRDSAGIQIIVAAGPSWGKGGGWRISSDPTLSIGEGEGDATTQFQQIVGIVRLSDSHIIVADAGSNSIRAFDGSGRLLRTLGRSGGGPGEFRALQTIKRVGTDSVMALDRRLSRVTIFDSSGAVGRIVQLPTRFVSVHPLADGMWLAAEEEGFFGGVIRQDASIGLHRFPSVVAILGPTGAPVDTLGAFPGAEMAYIEAGGHIGALPAAYGPVLTLGTRKDEIYIGIGNQLGYEVYSSDGRHLRSVRAQGPDRTLKSSDVSAFYQKVLTEIGDQAERDRFASTLRSSAVPERKAAYTRLLVDAHGNIWLSDYENPFVATGIWRVFSQQGGYLGEVFAAPQLRILEVGEDYVAGVWTGEFDVESVRVYQLNR